jgi:hypothetical protein
MADHCLGRHLVLVSFSDRVCSIRLSELVNKKGTPRPQQNPPLHIGHVVRGYLGLHHRRLLLPIIASLTLTSSLDAVFGPSLAGIFFKRSWKLNDLSYDRCVSTTTYG